MRILFDQGTPVPLREFLPEHEVSTAFQRGWSTLKNGELLDTAEREGFNVLVTTDSKLKFRQNLTGRRIAIAAGEIGLPKTRADQCALTADHRVMLSVRCVAPRPALRNRSARLQSCMRRGERWQLL